MHCDAARVLGLSSGWGVLIWLFQSLVAEVQALRVEMVARSSATIRTLEDQRPRNDH
jgi:hypothetical protein